MRRLFLGIILPMLCLVSLVSSAFATWYFDTNLNTNKEATIGVTVSKYAQVGDIVITSKETSYDLKLDQPNKTSSGLIFNGPLTATYYPAPASSNPTDPGYHYEQNLRFKLKVEVKIPVALSSYLAMKANTAQPSDVLMNGYTLISQNTNGFAIWTKEFNPTKISEVSAENNISVNKDDFIYNKVPQNITDYKAMLEVVKANSKIEVIFTASLTGDQFTQ